MKTKEIREIDAKELAEKIQEEQEKYNQMVLNHSISPLQNPSEIKMARRNIARMKTVLREKELNK